MVAEISWVLIISMLTFAFWQLFCVPISILTVSQDVWVAKQVCKI